MPGISRKGDGLSTGHICATTSTLATPGQGSVFANGKLVARKGDPTVAHPFPPVPVCAKAIRSVLLSRRIGITLFCTSVGVSKPSFSIECKI